MILNLEAYGVWVTDNPHGWNELHPAWKVKIL
jgi:phospholipase C